jgi:transcriptional regulator with XRE-family HTH domain
MKKILRSPEQLALQEMLKEARRRANLTQEVLGSKIGKPQSFVAKYEAGERLLNVIEFLFVLNALGVEPGDFISELNEKALGSTSNRAE